MTVDIQTVAKDRARALARKLAYRSGGKKWVVLIHKAEHLDFILKCVLTHWSILLPYGEPGTTDEQLEKWSKYVLDQLAHDIKAML